MKTWLHRSLMVFLFIQASTVEVIVKAKPIDVPHGCWSSQAQGACAVLNDKKLLHQKTEFGELRMSPDASFVREKTTEFKFVRGIFWVDVKEPVVLDTLFGVIALSEGETLIVAKDNVVAVTNLSSDMNYRPRGEQESHLLPKGMMVEMSHITESGVAKTGYPRPAAVDQLVALWSQVYSHDEVSDLRARIHDFFPAWLNAKNAVGPWYTEIVDREIASEKADEAEQARRVAARHAEAEKVRDLFRERNLLGVDPGETH